MPTVQKLGTRGKGRDKRIRTPNRSGPRPAVQYGTNTALRGT